MLRIAEERGEDDEPLGGELGGIDLAAGQARADGRRKGRWRAGT